MTLVPEVTPDQIEHRALDIYREIYGTASGFGNDQDLVARLRRLAAKQLRNERLEKIEKLYYDQE